MKRFIITLFLIFMFAAPGAMAHEMNWDNLMLASAKLNPDFDYEKNVDSYMALYMPEVWTKVKNDEFELEDKRVEVISRMKEKISSFPLEENFVLYTAINFRDYDFEKNVFPVDRITKDTYFVYEQKYGRNGELPFKYKVYLSNPEFVQDIKMSKEEAREFVKSRKSQFGKVDRTLVGEIKLQMKKIKETQDMLEAEIVGVTTYRDRGETSVLQQY